MRQFTKVILRWTVSKTSKQSTESLADVQEVTYSRNVSSVLRQPKSEKWQAGQLAAATQFRNELRSTSVTALPLLLIASSASAVIT